MRNVTIQRAENKDAPYIEEKLKKYLLDSTNSSWQQFFVARINDKTVAFGRIIEHINFFEIASLGVDYYHRKKGIGNQLLLFLTEEASRLDPNKPIYAVTHIPQFARKAGFQEVQTGPEALEYKRHYKCKLDASKIKIMKLKKD